MLSRSLLPTLRVGKRTDFTNVRQLHKAYQGAPPMRWLSSTEHVIRFLIVAFGAMSVPTYIMYNLDNYRPRPNTDLSEEMQQLIDERAARRKEGKQPILQDWPIIHQNKKTSQ